MTNTLRKPAWAGAQLRLDPGRFPQQVSYASRQDRDGVTFTLDRRGAVLLRKVLPQSGLPLSVALPVRAFKGIAARAMDHGDGTLTVTLELHHEDSELCVPLLVAHDLTDIAADWNAWSEVYGLPMLMIEADGSATTAGRAAWARSRPLPQSRGAGIRSLPADARASWFVAATASSVSAWSCVAKKSSPVASATNPSLIGAGGSTPPGSLRYALTTNIRSRGNG